jgi:hypothetical protein
MTTIVLQAAGTIVGGFLGGPFGAIIGRAAGAIAGSAIDAQLFGGVRKIEGPRLRDMDGLASAEGDAIPRVYGRAKVGGQLIWATRFEEEVTTTTRRSGGGKGGGPRVRETTYSYFANLAVALCEGPIGFVRRIWADGQEIDCNRVTIRIHHGDAAQQPDPLIIAKEGLEHAPAYRGVAYVVFERLPLAPYGNRVPQFAFEVVRPLRGLREQVRSVNLIPGSNEFAYQTALVTQVIGPGETKPENRNQLEAPTDVLASLDQLQALCPHLQSISIIATWFGDDLRIGQCSLAPRVDIKGKVTEPELWRAAGLTRAEARLVTQIDDRPAYGGTPTDASVIALIQEVKRRGLKVTLYPFIMMDIGPDNDLPDPYGRPRQPPFPWRGRITAHPAPGFPGSEDGTAAAAASVARFVGTVGRGDVSVADGAIICAKHDEWSFRRLILHYARLAALAGGVDAFVIGTEMVGATRVRSASGIYPFAQALIGVAADARAVLGTGVRLTYAADWTEYGAHVLGGGQEVRFPLDPLWASPHIDAVGIDYYAPISDWRDGVDHLDAAIARSCHDPAYLAARQTAGEAFDWFYADMAERRAQLRRPITDGAYGKPWIYRAKDLANWWLNPHVERVNGVELSGPTPWQPSGKPIWLTEIGCPAVDKGPNSPNVFPDPKSSEGMAPVFSTGERDDLVALRMLEAQIGVFTPGSPWFNPAANPARPNGGGRMIAADDITIWAWDARPFPAFPMRENLWSDGRNWQSGHWITGRLEAAPLDRLAAEILKDYGLPEAATLAIDALIDGYVLDRPMSAREALEPLARLFRLDASFREGRLVMAGRAGRAPVALSAEEFVPDKDGRPFSLRRMQETELPRELRVGYIDGEWDYKRAASRSRRLSGQARRETSLNGPIVTTRHQADLLTELALKEAWIGRETLSLKLAPRRLALEPGDWLSLPVDDRPRLFRVTEVEEGEAIALTALSAQREAGQGSVRGDDQRPPRPPAPQPVRPFAVMLDVPLVLPGGALLSIAATARPWPGALQVSRAIGPGESQPVATITQPALMGLTVTSLGPGPLWRWDNGNVLEIETRSGGLQSVSDEAALAGFNRFVLQGADGVVEIITAARVTLVAPGRYRLSRLLRGLGGSEAAAARLLPAGARVIGLDEALVPVATSLGDLGQTQNYRVAPPGVDLADPAVFSLAARTDGLALKPLAPVHLSARREAGGVRFAWIRRSRVDGDNWALAEIPLGEAQERYAFTLHGPAGPLMRAETGAAAYLYPAATELADFGAAQPQFDVSVAQFSAVVGEGWPARRVVTVG